jgi:uncharacterized membrane protein
MSSKINVFSASAGLQWLKQGWNIFKTQPMTFMFMYIFMIVVALIPLVLPPLQLVAAFTAPFLTIGFYLAVISKQQGKTISLADILKPFSIKGRRLNLFRLGLYQMGAVILLTLLADSLFSETFTLMQQATENHNHEQLLAEVMNTLSIGNIGLFLLAHAVNLMAFAFALPLVFFKGENRILKALGQSLKVFQTNMAPLTVFSLVIGVLMLAAMPLSFVPLLVIMPVAYIGFFCSYQAIFPADDISDNNGQGEKQASQSSEINTGRFDA